MNSSMTSTPRHAPGHAPAHGPADRPGCLTCVYMGMTAWEPRSGRSVMEEGIDAPRGFGADALDLHEIGQRGSFDRFQRAEMQKQRAFAGRSDARNFLQTGFTEIASAARPVRAY